MIGKKGADIEKIKNENLIGTGLYTPDYGAPNILMTGQNEAFPNAFQRFYMYKYEVWDIIECIIGGETGDPDQPFQQQLKGKKQPLNIPYAHLDHRAIKTNPYMYSHLLDMAMLQVYF